MSFYMNMELSNLSSSSFMALVLSSFGGPNDSPLVINPARSSPDLVIAAQHYGSKNDVISFKSPSGPKRAILWSLGMVFGCNVITPTAFAKGDRQVKQVLLGPLRGENERALAWMAQVLRQKCLGVSTFMVRLADGSDKIHGLSIKTYPSGGEAPSNGTFSCLFLSSHAQWMFRQARMLPGMGVTPNKMHGKGKGRADGGPSRSFLDMRDKTSWSTNDDSKLRLWHVHELHLICLNV